MLGVVGRPGSLLGDDPSAAAIAAAVVEPLVALTATDDLEPRLVVDVPSFENGGLAVAADDADPSGSLVATFRLRDGLTWHDGAPLTADDVRFAFERDRDAAPGSAAREMADRIDRIDAIDGRAFRVRYRPGERWDLFALAPRVLPRHLLDGAAAADLERYAANPVHAGPYRIVERTADAIVLEAFGGHAAGRARIGRIVARSYPDRASLVVALRAGEVDVAPSPGLGADLAVTLDRTFPGDVLYTPSRSIAMLRYGPRLETAARRAIALAVDRRRIADAVYAGRPRIPSGYLVPPLWAASEGGPPPAADPAAGRAAMAAAGYRRGDLGIAAREGDRLVVTLLVPAEPGLVDVARRVSVDLAVLGIAAEVHAMAASDVHRRVAVGDFDLALEIEAADDPVAATARYRGLVEPWWDVLADAALRADGRDAQRGLYAELQRIWSASDVALPLFQVLKVDLVAAHLDGIRPSAGSTPITWNVARWARLP